MKKFYDEMVPNYLNQLGKKYGTKVGTTSISTSKPLMEHQYDVVPMGDGSYGVINNGQTVMSGFNDEREAHEFIGEVNKAPSGLQFRKPVPYFAIPEEMRQQVLHKGQVLYSRKGTKKRYMADDETGLHGSMAEEREENNGVNRKQFAAQVYADWLEENGKPHTAEMIRLALHPVHGAWNAEAAPYWHYPNAYSGGRITTLEPPEMDSWENYYNERHPHPGTSRIYMYIPDKSTGRHYFSFGAHVPKEHAEELIKGLHSEGVTAGNDHALRVVEGSNPQQYARNHEPLASTQQIRDMVVNHAARFTTRGVPKSIFTSMVRNRLPKAGTMAIGATDRWKTAVKLVDQLVNSGGLKAVFTKGAPGTPQFNAGRGTTMIYHPDHAPSNPVDNTAEYRLPLLKLRRRGSLTHCGNGIEG
jgi:hypothetical protein